MSKLVPYALIMEYILYEKPAFFVVALLGLNASGVCDFPLSLPFTV